MLWVSSGFQTLKKSKTTRSVASWFQMFSHVWKPDETITLIFEIVLKTCYTTSLSGIHADIIFKGNAFDNKLFP